MRHNLLVKGKEHLGGGGELRMCVFSQSSFQLHFSGPGWALEAYLGPSGHLLFSSPPGSFF